MPPRPPKFSSRCPSRRHYGPSGTQLGAILALTSHICYPTLLKILTTSRQRCQKELEDPSRQRFSLILGPSRPRFSMILGTFCKYFKRCFAHCVRPPTCSFDASGQRFSFILVPFPTYFHHVLYMIPEAFCMPCACSFNLLRNRLDLDLVLRRSIGEAFSIRRSTYWML